MESAAGLAGPLRQLVFQGSGLRTHGEFHRRNRLLTRAARKAAQIARVMISVNSSGVSTIGLAFILLAFAAFSTSTPQSAELTP